jgi:HTH-type transcriptional regulator/antitoxin HigA
MEQMGYNQNDLANIVGLKSRASEILNRKETYIKWFVNFTRLNIPTDANSNILKKKQLG